MCKLSSKLCRSMLYLYSATNLNGAYQFYRSLRRSLHNHTSLDRNPNPKQNRSLGIEFWVAGINSKSRDCPENPSWPTRRHAGLRSSRHPLILFPRDFPFLLYVCLCRVSPLETSPHIPYVTLTYICLHSHECVGVYIQTRVG